MQPPSSGPSRSPTRHVPVVAHHPQEVFKLQPGELEDRQTPTITTCIKLTRQGLTIGAVFSAPTGSADAIVISSFSVRCDKPGLLEQSPWPLQCPGHILTAQLGPSLLLPQKHVPLLHCPYFKSLLQSPGHLTQVISFRTLDTHRRNSRTLPTETNSCRRNSSKFLFQSSRQGKELAYLVDTNTMHTGQRDLGDSTQV